MIEDKLLQGLFVVIAITIAFTIIVLWVIGVSYFSTIFTNLDFGWAFSLLIPTLIIGFVIGVVA
jgi:hypothetical protein